MKKLLLAFAVCIITISVANAQTPPLNKQQTIDYINELRNNSTIYKDEIAKFSLYNKALIETYSSGLVFRYELKKDIELEIRYLKEGTISNGYKVPQSFYQVLNKKDEHVFFNGIELESDANRHKKALEHLIGLVKAEKSTDPFDN